MQEHIDRQKRTSAKLWAWRAACAVAAASCLTIGLVLGLRGRSLDHEIIVPQGGLYSLVLEDGSQVWLNSDTHFTYPDKFIGRERRVSLDGEAYFKVTRDEKRPFYVESEGQELKVLGTEFNLRAYSEEKECVTTLVSGSVSINGEYTLEAGDRLCVESNGKASLSHGSTDAAQGWKDGRLVFGDESLEDAMKTICRWYGVNCEFLDDNAASTVLFGEITRYDSLDDVLDIIGKVGGLNVCRKENMITIASR